MGGRRWVVGVAVLAAGLVGAGPAFAGVDFAPRISIPTGAGAGGVSLGDLNGDGVTDAVVSSFSTNSVRIHLGVGGGNFSTGTSVTVGTAPFQVALGDFDGDGKQDIAATNSGSNSVTVLSGDGAGGVAATSAVPVGITPVGIQAGALDADARTDLVVTNIESRNLSILLGNADRTFTASFIPAGPLPRRVRIGDVTEDAVNDLVVTTFGETDVGHIQVLPGLGAGTFGPAQSVDAGTDPLAVTIADFNGDGVNDVATANISSYDVSVLLGLPGAGFVATPARPVSNTPVNIVAGDFNGDGLQDLAVTNSGSADVSVLEGAGGGAFKPARQFRAGRFPDGIGVADLNGDGRSDLVVANALGSLSILLARPLLSGTGTAKIRTACTAPNRVVHGISVNCITPFMSRAEVVEILGKPKAVQRNPARGIYVYRYGKLEVVFRTDTNWVDLVTTARPAANLANGLRIGSTEAQVRKKFPKLKCRKDGGVRLCTAVKNSVTFTGFTVRKTKVIEIVVGVR